MPVRLYLDAPLTEGALLTLPPEPSRHVQVLRMQPGDDLLIFNGHDDGVEWQAQVTRMGRQDVDVRIGASQTCQRELPRTVLLAVGMPANERMDALVEKATELGARGVQPLQCARSVLKLSGERAEKRRAHWQGVAVASSEQSGRTRVPLIEPIRTIDAWLAALPAEPAPSEVRHVLSFAPDAVQVKDLPADARHITFLSGPEGGLDPREEALARQRGFIPLSLGPRVLRADTAPLAALTLVGALG